MTYWLQELQQKRWEYCNGLDTVKCDSRAPPTPGDFAKGLVARDSAGESGGARARSLCGAAPRSGPAWWGRLGHESRSWPLVDGRLSAVTERPGPRARLNL